MARSRWRIVSMKAVNVGDCRYEKADANRDDDTGDDLGQRIDIV